MTSSCGRNRPLIILARPWNISLLLDAPKDLQQEYFHDYKKYSDSGQTKSSSYLLVEKSRTFTPTTPSLRKFVNWNRGHVPCAVSLQFKQLYGELWIRFNLHFGPAKLIIIANLYQLILPTKLHPVGLILLVLLRAILIYTSSPSNSTPHLSDGALKPSPAIRLGQNSSFEVSWSLGQIFRHRIAMTEQHVVKHEPERGLFGFFELGRLKW